MNYQADTFLTKEWFKLIKSNPGAFLEKCKVNFDKLHESPFYEGELWVHRPSIWEDSLMKTSLDKRIREFSHNINVRTNENRSVLKILKFESYQRRLITILFYLSSIAFLLKMKSRFYSDETAMIMLSLIFYQTAISILTFYTKEHNTNLFLVYALWIIYVFGELRPINSFKIKSMFGYIISRVNKLKAG